MSKRQCALNDLKRGEAARVVFMDSGAPLAGRLRDVGLIEGAWVKCLMKSPLGDPKGYAVRGAVIALRSADASGVLVERE